MLQLNILDTLTSTTAAEYAAIGIIKTLPARRLQALMYFSNNQQSCISEFVFINSLLTSLQSWNIHQSITGCKVHNRHRQWRFGDGVASIVVRSCSTLSSVSTGMGDRLRAGILPWYVTKPNRSTQPCIPLASLNRVPALIGWGKGGNVTSAGWQVTLCDPIWHEFS